MYKTMHTSKTKHAFYSKIEYVMLFLQLYLACGFGKEQMSGTLILGLQAALSAVLLMCRFFAGKTVKIKLRAVAYVSVIVTLILVGEVLRGGSFKHVQIAVYGIMIAYLFSICFSFSDYMEKFSNLMFFLCICSLILFVAYITVPQLVEKLPAMENVNGTKAYHMGFSTIYGQSRGVRNQGIFWEPGAFQTFVNLALIMEIFYLKKGRKSRIFVYLLTVFTTFSTTGYIVAVALLVVYFIQLLTDKKTQNKRNIGIMLFLLAFVSLAFWVLQNADSQLAGEVFGKLGRYQTGGKNTQTVDVRMNSIILPLQVLKQSPIWGIGYVGSMNLAHLYNGGMLTCTFVNWLSFYGTIVGFMFIRLYYLLALKLGENKWIGILLFAALFLTTVSEEFARNIFFLTMGFMTLSCNTDESNPMGEKDSI